MAAWDNPVAAPNYNPAPNFGSNLATQLGSLLQRPQQQQQQQPLPGQQQQRLLGPIQGQPTSIQPQLPLAQRLAALLGNFGQPQGNQGTPGGTGANPYGGQGIY